MKYHGYNRTNTNRFSFLERVTYSSDSKFKIAREGGEIVYIMDDVVYRTLPDVYPDLSMVADITIYDIPGVGVAVRNLMINRMAEVQYADCGEASGINRKYRYGFNGMEKDDEAKGAGNSYTTEFRQYDPRLGRWLSLDPRKEKYPNISPYVAFANNPIIYLDNDGDTVRFAGMSDIQIEEFQAFLSVARSSDLFNYYYTALEQSNTVYYIRVDENLTLGGRSISGQFNSNDNTVTIKSISRYIVTIQELFHAYQKDLGVYNRADHAIKETEGDLMTEYVVNEAGLGFGSMLSEQGMLGGWGEYILEINGSRYDNPTNEQVQNEEYNKLFTEAVDKRIEHFKIQGEGYEGYTTPNSGSEPKAIKEVFNKVYGDKK